MKGSTTHHATHRLVLGTLLTTVVSPVARGFSLQLCPIPPAAADFSRAAPGLQGDVSPTAR